MVKAVLPDLGKDLPILADGSRDKGLRQDIFHLQHRITKLLPTMSSMKAVAGKRTFQISPFLDSLNAGFSQLAAKNCAPNSLLREVQSCIPH